MIIRNLTPFSPLMEKQDQKKIEETIVGIGLADYSLSKEKSLLKDSKHFLNKINELGRSYSVDLQIYNPTYMILPDQLYYAINYATLAFYNNKNISKNSLVEYLLFASGQKQIHIALDHVGFNYDDQNQKFAFTIVGKDLDVIKKVNTALMQLVDIKEIELDSVEYSMEQLSVIQKKMEISDFQLQNALNILNTPRERSNNEMSVQTVRIALINCMKEKMAFLFSI